MSVSKRVGFLKLLAFLLLIGPGFMMILGSKGPFMPAINAFLDFAHQPYDGLTRVSGEAGFLLNAILGGILIGFGTMIWMVAEHVFRHDLALGRKIILTALLAWFITDSLGSILTGAWFNSVINLVILLSFLTPLFIGKEKTA